MSRAIMGRWSLADIRWRPPEIVAVDREPAGAWPTNMRVAFRALFERFPDLRLAAPPAEVPLRDDAVLYGVWRLPVTWQPIPPAGVSSPSEETTGSG